MINKQNSEINFYIIIALHVREGNNMLASHL